MADRSEESRVLEYVTVTGTGPVTTGLASPNGPVVGMRGFAAISGLAAGDTFDYFIEAIDGFGQRTGTYEEGQGVWIGAGQFNRTQVWRSSNGNAAVNFAAGTKVCGISISGRTWAAVQLAARRWRERVYRPGTLTSSQVVHRVPVDEAVAIPANWANSLATCETAPNAAVTLGIFAGATGATQIGTISFASGATTGTFTSPSGAAQAIAANDILRIVGPSSANGTFAGVSITLVGFRNIEPAALEPIAAYANWKTDPFTGNGSQTAFTLSSDPGSIHNMQVSVAGAVRVAGIDYTLSGTTLTFTTAPANGALVAVRYGIPLPLGLVAAAQVRYNAGEAGGPDRTSEQKLRELKSPEDFGLVGDGVTDDSVRWAAMVASGRCIRGTPGKTYLVDGGATATAADQVFDFSGCTIKRKNNSSHAPLIALAGARQQLWGGRWDGNKANQSSANPDHPYAHANILVQGDDCEVLHTRHVDSWGIGIKGADCSYAKIKGNRIRDCALYGIYVEGITVDEFGNDIEDNTVWCTGLPSAHGIYLTGSNDFTKRQRDWTVSGNKVYGSQATGVTGIGITTRGIEGECSDNRCVGFSMGISADSALDSVINDNNVRDTAGTVSYGIELNAGGNVVNGNNIRRCKYGICVSGTEAAQNDNLLVTNNISGCLRSIFVQASSNPANRTTILANVLRHTGTTTGQVGVYLQGGCQKSVVAGNHFCGPGSGIANTRAVFLDGVSSDVAVDHNTMRGWERTLGLYSASAMTYTRVSFCVNHCADDCGSATNFITLEGSATAGANITQMWNLATSGVRYNVLDRATNLQLTWLDSFSTPEGNWAAGPGSIFGNLNGGAGSTLFAKRTGSGNTGWAAAV